MKKLNLLSCLICLLTIAKAQVRLTEVFTVDKENQYIELFAKGSPTGINIGDHYILSYLKNHATGLVTIYIMDFNAGENPFVNNSYAVYSKYSGDKVPPNSYTYRTFSSTATVSKYIKPAASGSFSSVTIGSTEDYFSHTQDEMAVFLLRKSGLTGTNTTVVDFVTSVNAGGSQITKISFINASLDSLPVLVHDGVRFDLKPVLVSKAKHVNENLGQSSYNLRLENCIPVWYKDPRTPTYGQFTDDVPTWDAFSFYYQSTGNRTIDNTMEHYAYTASGVIPQTSLSYLNLVTVPPISSGFECYINFRYLINADISNVRLTLFTDMNGNHIIDPADQVITGYDSIVPSTLPMQTHDGENFYKLNFQLTRVSPTANSFYPVLIQTEYAINNGSCTFNTFEEILFADIQPLPVRLGQFSIQFEKPLVRLKWNTFTESNNRGFQIERSVGIPNRWYPIAFIGTRAKDGNSQSRIDYEFEDEDIQPGVIHYYRLNQFDFDGKSELGPVRTIRPGIAEFALHVYPNPTSSNAIISFNIAGSATLFVINSNGQTIRQMKISGGKTRLDNLTKGKYVLKIVDTETGMSIEKKLVVLE